MIVPNISLGIFLSAIVQLGKNWLAVTKNVCVQYAEILF